MTALLVGIGNVPKWDPPVRKKTVNNQDGEEEEEDASEAGLIREGNGNPDGEGEYNEAGPSRAVAT